MSQGRGTELFSPEGKRYLDFASGIGVTSTGHCHPKVVAAVQAQAARGVHFQQQCGYNEKMLELIDRMQPHLPEGL